VPFLDMAASTFAVGEAIEAQLAPAFAELGLALESFTVENLSLPEELQKRLDERIGMNMVGNLGDYARYQAAQSIPIAAANEGGIAGLGAGLGAGALLGQQMAQALGGAPAAPPAGVPTPPAPPSAPPPAGAPTDSAAGAAGGVATKFCMHCGKAIPRTAKFCPECGGTQE
jgi:membrane protease subunit (stomatin/prohibitin family)